MYSLYGINRQIKFGELYKTYTEFLTDYNSFKADGLDPAFIHPTGDTDTKNTIKVVYLLLAGRYANSTIASSDTNRFKIELFGLIYQHGGYWEKKRDIQEKLRTLTDAQLIDGSESIFNHAYNPDTAPSTDSYTALTYINQQTSQKLKKGILEAYNNLLALINKDLTEEFLGKFKRLFKYVVKPELPLWYITELEEEYEDDND